MDLRTGNYFWLAKDGEVKRYNRLESNQNCEIAIIGGGITAAIVAYKLTRAGYECLILDKNEICKGSTLASTSILQYEIDTPLYELKDLIGLENANLAYKLCYSAIHDLAKLSLEISSDTGFMRKKSLYLAKTESDVDKLKEEYSLRKALGIELEYLEANDIKKLFPFSAPAALYSENAAVMDSFLFAHKLFERASEKGCRIFANSPMNEYLPTKDGVKLKVGDKFEVNAKHVVFCTGYESQSILKEKIVNLISTYAITTNVLPDFKGWNEGCIIWETGKPYYYLRPTTDNRAMIGGCDKPFRYALMRDLLIPFASRHLIKKFNSMFPGMKAKAEYKWTGTFGETKDGLAYIGPSPEYEKSFFALGFGGNGITFSSIASDLIFDFLEGRTNPALNIFRFGR